jgi:hypothetical protein
MEWWGILLSGAEKTSWIEKCVYFCIAYVTFYLGTNRQIKNAVKKAKDEILAELRK